MCKSKNKEKIRIMEGIYKKNKESFERISDILGSMSAIKNYEEDLKKIKGSKNIKEYEGKEIQKVNGEI